MTRLSLAGLVPAVVIALLGFSLPLPAAELNAIEKIYADLATLAGRQAPVVIPAKAPPRHSGESRNPACFGDERWMPAFAGMTGRGYVRGAA